MRSVFAALALVAAFASPVNHAAVVEAVQYPAWLDRIALTVPLEPGTELRPRDRIRTGKDARVYIKLDEGSTVKLGEKAEFSLRSAQSGQTYKAALDVLTGAFRFTTNALERFRKRDINIKVRNVTAGIRGTDLWGKSNDERDLVCLLEGTISVQGSSGSAVTLNQPLQFFQQPPGGAPLPVGLVEAAQVQQWAQETEISAGAAAASGAGRANVIAGEFASRDDARALRRTLRNAGYPVSVASEGGQHRVRISALVDRQAADALAARLRDEGLATAARAE